MRERIRDIDRLLHIDECITRVQAFLDGKTFEEGFFYVKKRVERHLAAPILPFLLGWMNITTNPPERLYAT